MRVWPLLCAAVLVVAAVDDVDLPDILLERLAFGSCNKQGREALWDAIADESPQAFLWTGDAGEDPQAPHTPHPALPPPSSRRLP
mmetsp:Transcript_17641/g.51603  ORF Transcript_17641/g.51603 Transcript_17641/m.51603 type:complete len:85 (+) Transcript_17641:15-269(+)